MLTGGELYGIITVSAVAEKGIFLISLFIDIMEESL